MNRLLPLFISIISFTPSYSSELIIGNTTDSLKVNSWTQKNFIKEFGINDSANALINLFSIKNRRAKNQTIIGTAFLIGGTIAVANNAEPGDDQKRIW